MTAKEVHETIKRCYYMCDNKYRSGWQSKARWILGEQIISTLIAEWMYASNEENITTLMGIPVTDSRHVNPWGVWLTVDINEMYVPPVQHLCIPRGNMKSTKSVENLLDYGEKIHDLFVLEKNFNLPPRDTLPSIKNVIFNGPATIVFWGNGDKTVVKAGEGELFDPEKGLAMAISKKILGNESNYYNEFKKWLPEEAGTMSAWDCLKERIKNLHVVEEKEKVDARCCDDCKFNDHSGKEEPCRSCDVVTQPVVITHSNFEPKED